MKIFIALFFVALAALVPVQAQAQSGGPDLPVKPPQCSLGQVIFGNCAAYMEEYNRQMLDWQARQADHAMRLEQDQADREMLTRVENMMTEQRGTYMAEIGALTERVIQAETSTNSGEAMAQVAIAALSQAQTTPQLVYLPSAGTPGWVIGMLVLAAAIIGAGATVAYVRLRMAPKPYRPDPMTVLLDYAAPRGYLVKPTETGEVLLLSVDGEIVERRRLTIRG